jgi:hypothetical protein
MKKINFNIILFILTLFIFGAFNLASFGNSDTAELENRSLSSKPNLTLDKLFSGEFTREYEDYYSDHFMYRDRLVKISSAVNEVKGIGNNEAQIISHRGDNTAEANLELEVEENRNTTKSETKDSNSDTKENYPQDKDKKDNQTQNPSSKQPSKENSGTKIGKMLILNDKAMEIYTFNNNESKFYAGVINDFEDKLEHKVRVYSLLVPTQVEFIENEKYKTISSSQKNVIEYINKSFNENIIPVNAYDVLSQNKDKYLYFRTDHHWTALGAYYAYTAFAETADETPVPLEQYEKSKVDNFLGSTYSATLNKKLQNNPDTIFFYKPFTKHEYKVYYEGPLKMNLLDMNHANKKNKYRIFLSGDRPLGKIVTEVKNDKKILVVKDSYGNAFVPFLLPHYNEIYIVDPRQFKHNIIEFTKENGIQEVLFLNYVPASNMRNFSNLIVNLMNK